jgi:hypothetical protein
MLKRLTLLSALCLAAVTVVGTRSADAATLPVPSVEYSADRVMQMEAGTIEGKVYSSKGKERMETSMKGMTSVMILRSDKKESYMLMPAQKMYMQMDFSKAQAQSGAQPADSGVEITEVGSDTVEGQATTKYKMIMKDGSAGGFLWITKDGIVMKMDGVVKNGNDKSRITMTLKNLKIGSQDAALFEVPAGYTKLPAMGNMGGFGGMPPGAGR